LRSLECKSISSALVANTVKKTARKESVFTISGVKVFPFNSYGDETQFSAVKSGIEHTTFKQLYRHMNTS